MAEELIWARLSIFSMEVGNENRVKRKPLSHRRLHNGGGKIEALVNMEDFYKMLDSINPHILTDYIYMRLKH